jgi:hypothetical protein
MKKEPEKSLLPNGVKINIEFMPLNGMNEKKIISLDELINQIAKSETKKEYKGIALKYFS